MQGLTEQLEAGQPATVLCVDDEKVGLMVRRMLLERAGYKVLTAEGGLEALAKFQNNDVDLVVLDYSMPGMNGGDVALELRKRRPAVPILLLSAYVSMPDDVLSRVDQYLVKGDGAPALLARVQDMLASSRGASA